MKKYKVKDQVIFRPPEIVSDNYFFGEITHIVKSNNTTLYDIRDEKGSVFIGYKASDIKPTNTLRATS